MSQLPSSLRSMLMAARNRDGGWPYASGKESRLEPTCWALLALAHADGAEPDVDVLLRWRQQGGWLADVAGVPPNYAFNALAGLTLLQARSAAPQAEALGTRLVLARGIATRQATEFRQDNSLRGWSWIDGTFSWVEPTAWSVLLLKQLRSAGATLSGAQDRIDVGEQLLLDRACSVGGWNYGSSNVYGQELWPYVPTTALGLLAMQDRRDHPVVAKSLQQLQRAASTERSAVALTLAIICLRVYGVSAGVQEGDLLALSGERAAAERSGDDLLGLAMTIHALADARTAPPFLL